MTVRGGRYEKLAEIASGGMATVYLCRALGAGGFERLVAIKEMHPHLARETEFVAMFLDEARLAARIHHPNVVATVDVGQDEEGLFLVMEYVEGPALQQMLQHLHDEHKRLPVDVGLRIFLDALAGLHAAHELKGPDGASMNLVHRDVSPQNVLVGTDGLAKITDFGVARAESRLSTTRAGAIKGKVPYMAPEQLRSQPIDRRTDVYAAGVVLWEMLSTRRLVNADNEAAMVFQITGMVPASPREHNPDVPEPIARVCLQALSKAPEERFATAADFAEALEDAAREAAQPIATPRAVSAFVRELGAHKAPRPLAAVESVRTPAPPVKSAVSAVTTEGTHQRTALASDANEPRTRVTSGTRAVAVGAVFGALLLAGGAFLLLRGPGAPSQNDASSVTVAAPPPPAPSPVLPAPSAAPTSSAATNAAPTAAAVSTTVPATSPTTGARRATPTTGNPRAGGYRPREL
jgi:serine/threonine-protein kinase